MKIATKGILLLILSLFTISCSLLTISINQKSILDKGDGTSDKYHETTVSPTVDKTHVEINGHKYSH